MNFYSQDAVCPQYMYGQQLSVHSLTLEAAKSGALGSWFQRCRRAQINAAAIT